MTTVDLYIEQAIPHEAGHILVGRILGLPVLWLDHFVKRGPNHELVPGDFATKVLAPPPTIIPSLPTDVREALILQIGGGLSGNLVSGVTADPHGIDDDRKRLKVLSNKALEEVAESARRVIEEHIDKFEDLRTVIRNSYVELMKDKDISAARHQLLSGEQLDQVCPQNKVRFPMLFT